MAMNFMPLISFMPSRDHSFPDFDLIQIDKCSFVNNTFFYNPLHFYNILEFVRIQDAVSLFRPYTRQETMYNYQRGHDYITM